MNLTRGLLDNKTFVMVVNVSMFLIYSFAVGFMNNAGFVFCVISRNSKQP